MTDKIELEKTVVKETADEFSKRVEEYVWMEDVTYYEAVISLMEKSLYEPEFTAKLLTTALKAQLAIELQDINLIKNKKKPE